MRITNYYIWSFVFGVFFLIFVGMLLVILDTEARMTYEEFTPFHFVLLTLATWRLTRLITHDHITAFIREQVYDVKKVGRKVTLARPGVGPRRVLADLFGCPWCVSIWSATILGFAFLVWEPFFYITLLLALSAVATAAQVFFERSEDE